MQINRCREKCPRSGIECLMSFFFFIPPFTKFVFIIYLALLFSRVPSAACHPFPSSTPLSYSFACLHSFLRKLINFQAELTACVLSFSLGGLPICLSACLSLALTTKSVCTCVGVCLLTSLCGFAHPQVNTRPNSANDCTHVVPDSMTNNR